jgi:hyperosmotically inducible protein
MPPPPPASTTTHRQYDVPQAKTLSQTPDVVLNSRVRAALISGLSGVGAQDIDPETTKGVVTLTGSVRTAQQRAQAEQVARKVRGIKAVKNKLAVKPGA